MQEDQKPFDIFGQIYQSCQNDISRIRRLASICQLKTLEGIVIIQHIGGVVKDLVLGYGLISFYIGSDSYYFVNSFILLF
jgi:hypothetical protein